MSNGGMLMQLNTQETDDSHITFTDNPEQTACVRLENDTLLMANRGFSHTAPVDI